MKAVKQADERYKRVEKRETEKKSTGRGSGRKFKLEGRKEDSAPQREEEIQDAEEKVRTAVGEYNDSFSKLIRTIPEATDRCNAQTDAGTEQGNVIARLQPIYVNIHSAVYYRPGNLGNIKKNQDLVERTRQVLEEQKGVYNGTDKLDTIRTDLDNGWDAWSRRLERRPYGEPVIPAIKQRTRCAGLMVWSGQ